ncbi:hypothetical protein BOX15_Mlig012253g2 [Macrostomum lignano]|uniref:EGF-like domain-containing protein n=1 Tax=Macrostomum lignano TaxID=282301 RepID=A0A267H0L0_9PLAT|nr:hypothetical protein BOX15_Mlig012253g2 [Macrostomum lignano]
MSTVSNGTKVCLLFLYLAAPSQAANCSTVTCYNGGTCNNFTDSPPCLCPLPYIAPYCESAADYCFTLQPDKGITELPVCLNDGNCTLTYTDPYFNCTCPPEYTGNRCNETVTTSDDTTSSQSTSAPTSTATAGTSAQTSTATAGTSAPTSTATAGTTAPTSTATAGTSVPTSTATAGITAPTSTATTETALPTTTELDLENAADTATDLCRQTVAIGATFVLLLRLY